MGVLYGSVLNYLPWQLVEGITKEPSIKDLFVYDFLNSQRVFVVKARSFFQVLKK
jgi:hypothetical protein